MDRAVPFSFLDLAAGDASASSKFLLGTRIASYTAVDFSKPARAAGFQNTTRLFTDPHGLYSLMKFHRV